MLGFSLLPTLRSRTLAARFGNGHRAENRTQQAGSQRRRSRRAAAKPIALRHRYHSWQLPRRIRIGS